MLEQFYTCPFCLTEVSILIDPSIREQSYIEDCERCCRPIEFYIKTDGYQIMEFSYQAVEQ
jgi:hypothetical protein